MELETLIGIGLALVVGAAAGFAVGRRFPSAAVAERRLCAVLDTADAGVMINTRDGRNLYRNDHALAFFRVPADEFAKHAMTARYADPDDRARHIAELYRDGAVTEEEVTFLRGDGERFVGRMSSALIDFGGRRCHISWFMDVSAEKAAAAARRLLAERLAMALEATRAAAWDADLVAGRFWWSDTFPRMLGFDRVPEMPPDFWESRLHPDDRDRVLATIESHLRGESAVYDYAYRLRTESGGWLWIEAKGRCLRDADGRAVRYVGIMTDISERRVQEERVRASEARLIRILETAPVAVNITTPGGDWLFCNAQSCAIMGVSRQELTSVSTPTFYADRADRKALLERFQREGPFRDAEIRFRRPDGSLVWVLSSWDEIVFDGQRALVTWLYDITGRKQEEAEFKRAKEAAERALGELRVAQESLIQAETMASLGALVAGVAHEVNTPIGIGLTAATHIAEQARALHDRFRQGSLRRSEMAEYLETIIEGSGLMVSNISRAAELIQSFKQVAVDQSSGERRGFDLATYIGEVLFSLRPRLKRTTLTVEVDCPEGITMDSYPGALSQVLTNLVINAIVHAYADGAGSGTIRIGVVPKGGDAVVLTFADDGVGMAPEVRSHIFEPFFTTRRGRGGSGLGLHILFNTVTQMLGGSVEVESAPGQGTRFILSFPRVSPPAKAPPQAAVLAGD
ncbi:PAS domain S-box protein [Azospirillum oleiclasticum]